MPKAQHVVQAPNGGWNVVSSGAVKARKHFRDQSSAIAFAREVSKDDGVDLYIHTADGTVERKEHYSTTHQAEDLSQH